MCPTDGHFEVKWGQNIISTKAIVFSASVHLQMDGQWFTFPIMGIEMRIMAITCSWNDVYFSINKIVESDIIIIKFITFFFLI